MKAKRIIAREWLLFLLFFFAGPPIIAGYKWASAPRIITDGGIVRLLEAERENTLEAEKCLNLEEARRRGLWPPPLPRDPPLYDLVALENAPDETSRQGSKTPNIGEVVKGPTAWNVWNGQGYIPYGSEEDAKIAAAQLLQVPQLGQIIKAPTAWNVWNGQNYSYYNSEEDAKIAAALVKSAGLTLKKKPLWNYLIDSMKTLNGYFVIVFTYPAFLFIRSIVWSLRTLKCRTP